MSRSIPHRMLTRRHLLKRVGAGAMLPVTGLARGESPIETLRDPGDARSRFNFSEDLVPMNAANLCPAPAAVTNAHFAYQRDIDRDPSAGNRSKYVATHDRVRERLGGILNVSADEVAIVRNASEGNNIIVWGYPLSAGDEVIVWDENHESLNVSWDVRSARDGIVVRRVRVPGDPADPADIVAAFAEQVSGRTRVLAVSQVSNVSGYRLPVADLAGLARARDLFFVVDGAQTLGVDVLDLDAMGCDAFTGSAHKWLMGPAELGVLVVRERRIAEIWPLGVSLHWGDQAATELVGARKLENFGQRDDAGIAALSLALAMHETIGPGIQAYVDRLAGRLRNGLLASGLKLAAPDNDFCTSPVVVVRQAPAARQAIVDSFYHDHGLIVASKGGIRISPHVYNTEDHIERVLNAVSALRGRFGQGAGATA